MSVKIRHGLSRKNKYFIEKERHLELVHFCLQYPIWKKAYNSLDGLSKRPTDLNMIFQGTNYSESPTERCVMARENFSRLMGIVEQASKETDDMLGKYILIAVTEGYSYETLRARYDIPCCRDTYYNLYRKFFWVLNSIRD